MSISYESKIGFAVLERLDKSSSLFIYFTQKMHHAIFFFLIDTSKKHICPQLFAHVYLINFHVRNMINY